MQNFEHLGIKPVVTPVASIQPGDCVPVAGKRLMYQQAYGVTASNGVANIKTLGFRDFRKGATGRYAATAQLPIYRREDVAAALEAKILDFVQPGIASKTPAEVFCYLRDRLDGSPGQKRVEATLRRMEEQGILLETLTQRKSRLIQGYRLPLTSCLLPQAVMERQYYRVGWVVGFQEQLPAPRPYPIVQWFNGSRSLVRDKSLEPLDSPRALRAMEQAIAHLHGHVSSDFIRVPREMLQRLISPRGGMNVAEMLALGDFLMQPEQGFRPNPRIYPKEAVLTGSMSSF